MIDLEALGMTQEELQERVVQTIAETALTTLQYDPDEGEFEGTSALHKRLDRKIQDLMDKAINDLAAKHVLPHIVERIESAVLQQTTKWGEKKGEPVTFTEFLVARAEHYLQEEVDYAGKNKDEGGYNWSGAQTRLTHLINDHLQYSISTAMYDALKSVNEQISEGIAETVKIQLREIVAKIKPKVTI